MINNYMKYILLLPILITGCMSKLVKHNKLDVDSPNISVQPIAPFHTPTSTHGISGNNQTSMYDATNDIAIIIGLIVLIIGFLPLILSYIDYVSELVKNWYSSRADK